VQPDGYLDGLDSKGSVGGTPGNDVFAKVLVFTTANFDAGRIDVASVLFAGAGAASSRLRDVDSHGLRDLVLRFNIQETELRTNCEVLVAEDLNEDGKLDSNR
jgi:hypothetical protein